MNKFETAMAAKQDNNTVVRLCRKSTHETLDWLTLNGRAWEMQNVLLHSDVRKMIDAQGTDCITPTGKCYIAVL